MTDERHKEWLAGLKKGDEAVIESWHGLVLEKVERTTPKRVIVDRYTFMRTDGSEYGAKRGFLSTTRRLIEPTPDIKAEIEQKELRDSLENKVNDGCQYMRDVRKLSTSQLQRIADILDESDEL